MVAGDPVRAVVVAVAALMVVTACDGGQEGEMGVKERAADRAVEVRATVDALAALLGTRPEVKQDELIPCEPGDRESLEPVYIVHVPIEAGTLDRVRGEIADRYAADGWTVRRDAANGDSVSTRFLKGSSTVGVRVNEAVGNAVVGGSGGCVD